MTIIGWRHFTYRCLMQTPVKYKFSESLRIVVYESIFLKIRELSFQNIAPYFPKYQGSLINFISSQISAGGRDQYRFVFLTPFSKKGCWEIIFYLVTSPSHCGAI